ncbi:aminopeptidase Ey-like isoform X1 [Schistocerca gregaria]|uniref:aminopeptidase Ey-like isoform X1 n=2 Tax=Schistocerca gregaria TaxID=7010 RepID=UPI00211E304A|nr:aminopeptidase Ey-like isoform X1 [Schistocerca gregaria]
MSYMCVNSPPQTMGLSMLQPPPWRAAVGGTLWLLVLLLQSQSASGTGPDDTDSMAATQVSGPERGKLHGTTVTQASGTNASSSFRLSNEVLPSHYDIFLETYLGDDSEGFMFKGHVVITLSATAPVRELRLHAKNLMVDEEAVRLTSQGPPAPALRRVQLDADRDFLVLQLDGPLEPGAAYRLRLAFAAPLEQGLAGYYRSSYRDRASGDTRWMAVTQFEPTDARRAFPCFDEPAFKATFSIGLAHHNKYSAISNMPLVTSQQMEGRAEWMVDRFEQSLRMPTYLVAFVVSDLEHVDSATGDNTTLFRVWARREALLQAGYASAVGPGVLTFYERFFQVLYPLPKLDMVAIPDFAAGAMENWGLVTYRERLLLFDSAVSSVLAKRDVASVIAHELAHQWFGNLVTMRWWTDLWLNEGFATYVATLGVHDAHPNWKTLEADALANMLTVLKFDALETSHALSVKLKNPNEISQIFDTISYKKGSFLIRMMSHFLGETVFRDGLTSYLRKHRLDNAEQSDLWAALTAEAHRQGALPTGVTVEAVMDTWTLQTGYPLLTVSRDYRSGTLSITQVRYLSYQPSDVRRSNVSQCWEVPVTYSLARNPDEVRREWLHCDRGQPNVLTLPLDAAEGDWVLLNVHATGLYRVLYDSRGWVLLAEALKGSDPSKSGIDRLSRAQLVGDALALAWSGDLPYEHALSLLTYLQHEPDYLPWKAAFSGLSNIYRLMRRTASFGLFRMFVTQLMAEPMKTWVDLQRPLASDDLEGFMHRRLMVSWACKLGVADCVQQATKLFADWMRQPDPDRENPVPPGLRYEVVCTALRHGGEARWRFAWGRYLASNVASERVELLQALTCAREPWLLQRLLEWSVLEGYSIRPQDSATVFSGVAQNEYGFHIAEEFFYRNITQLHQFYGPKASRLSRYVKAIAEDMYTERELKEFEGFAAQSADHLKQASLAVKQARDKISVNVAWMRSHYAELARQLARVNQQPAAAAAANQ